MRRGPGARPRDGPRLRPNPRLSRARRRGVTHPATWALAWPLCFCPASRPRSRLQRLRPPHDPSGGRGGHEAAGGVLRAAHPRALRSGGPPLPRGARRGLRWKVQGPAERVLDGGRRRRRPARLAGTARLEDGCLRARGHRGPRPGDRGPRVRPCVSRPARAESRFRRDGRPRLVHRGPCHLGLGPARRGSCRRRSCGAVVEARSDEPWRRHVPAATSTGSAARWPASPSKATADPRSRGCCRRERTRRRWRPSARARTLSSPHGARPRPGFPATRRGACTSPRP